MVRRCVAFVLPRLCLYSPPLSPEDITAYGVRFDGSFPAQDVQHSAAGGQEEAAPPRPSTFVPAGKRKRQYGSVNNQGQMTEKSDKRYRPGSPENSEGNRAAATATPTTILQYRNLPEGLIACKYVSPEKKNKDKDNPAEGEMDNGGKVRSILGQEGSSDVRKDTTCFLYWEDESHTNDNNSWRQTQPKDVCLKVVHWSEDWKEEKVVCELPNLGDAVRDDCNKRREYANSADLKLTECAEDLFGNGNEFFFVCSYTVEGEQRVIRSPLLQLGTHSQLQKQQQLLQQSRRKRLWTIGKPEHTIETKGLRISGERSQKHRLSEKQYFWKREKLREEKEERPQRSRRTKGLLSLEPKSVSVQAGRWWKIGQPTQIANAKGICLLAFLVFGFSLWGLSQDEVQRQMFATPPPHLRMQWTIAHLRAASGDAASDEHKQQTIVDLRERLELLLHHLRAVAEFHAHSHTIMAELDERLELLNKTTSSHQRESPESIQLAIADLRKGLVMLLAVAGGASSESREDMQQAIVDLRAGLETLPAAELQEPVQQSGKGRGPHEANIEMQREFMLKDVARCHKSLVRLFHLTVLEDTHKAIADMHEWLELLFHDLVTVVESQEYVYQAFVDVQHEKLSRLNYWTVVGLAAVVTAFVVTPLVDWGRPLVNILVVGGVCLSSAVYWVYGF